MKEEEEEEEGEETEIGGIPLLNEGEILRERRAVYLGDDERPSGRYVYRYVISLRRDSRAPPRRIIGAPRTMCIEIV